MQILIVNAGSSSLKLRVLDGADDTITSTEVERWAGQADLDALGAFIHRAGPVDAVGHRIVHGGERFDRATVLTPAVIAQLARLRDLAPLHQPRSKIGRASCRERVSSVV